MLSKDPANRNIRHLKYNLRGKELIISGSCLFCGGCCRKINLYVNGSFISSRRRYTRIVKKYPDFGRFKIVGRSSKGALYFSCTWLQDDNTCRDYENRLDFCRKYPDRDFLIKNGVPSKDCGYIV